MKRLDKIDISGKMDKPWLKAKTAGDALLEAQAYAAHKPPWAPWYDFEAACVIEWHKAQRETVGEFWRVHYTCIEIDSRSVSRWSTVHTTLDKARKAARAVEKDTEARIVHVTRYRRKR